MKKAQSRNHSVKVISLNINPAILAKRGEVWEIDLNPTVGAEMQKIRPCLVVSSDAVGNLPLKLIGPITDYKDKYATYLWHVQIDPDQKNGLTKKSSFDALQLRGVDLTRFKRKLGLVSAEVMEEVAAAIAAVVEYQ